MGDKKNCQDLEEDEELSKLRMAALATLQRQKKSQTDTISNILTINSIARVPDFSSNHGSHKNKNPWSNNNQTSKRKGKNFPKSSQRSSLIVITPINADNKKTTLEKQVAPKLMLPQYKWLQNNTEDSSSPKPDRRTGPSRFNRHCSESESSESDCDDSDDSYSNDTVLMDEHSRLSSVEVATQDSDLKHGLLSEHRLNFQNLDSNIEDNNFRTEYSDVCNSNKDARSPGVVSDEMTDQKISELPKIQNKITNYDKSVSKTDTNKYAAHQSNLNKVPEKSSFDTVTSSFKVSKQRRKHTPIKFDLFSESDDCIPKPTSASNQKNLSNNSLDKTKNITGEPNDDSRPSDSSENKSILSRNDLRFELKRIKANIEKEISPKEQKSSRVERPPSKDRSRRHVRSRSKDRSKSPVLRRSYRRSRSRSRSFDRKRSRSRSRSYDRKRSRSSSRSFDRRRSRYSKTHTSDSRSSRSSSTSSYSSSSSSSDSDRKKGRGVLSVVKPVMSKIVMSDKNSLTSALIRKPPVECGPIPMQKPKCIEIKLKSVSNIKVSVPVNDQKSNVPEVKKRGPVHMRLGTLPRKRVIQMPKDVEAAFVTTSSDDDNDVNSKCKKSNIIVVNDMYSKKVEVLSKFPEKNMVQRSGMTSASKGRFFR